MSEIKMQEFIGTKRLNAFAMNKADYNKLRGWGMPLNEDGTECGFLVEYLDGGESNHPDFEGYVSWSPHDVFVKSYQYSGALSFGHAIEYMKLGKKVSRKGWNGKDMWVCLTQGSTVPKEHARSGAVLKCAEEGAEEISIYPHLDMKTVRGDIICGWLATQTDMLENDWYIVQ